MLKRFSLILLVGAVAFFIAAPAWADFTGLNIVPDAQVQDDGALTFMVRGDWGNSGFDDGHYIGFSYGLMDYLEIGGSWRLTEDEDFRGDPTFDVKFRYNLAPEMEPCPGSDEEAGCGGCKGLATGIAVGAYNINFDEDENGNMVPYLVYTHDFEGFRGSLGYSFEEDNGAIFSGWELDAGDGVLKWDWTQISDGNDWNSSVGFETPFYWDDWLDGDWTIGSWLMFTSNDAGSDVWTVEVSYTLP